MSHLGDRAAALVDGQLSADAAERAAMHLVGCRPCRDAVELERLTKHRLATLRSPEPSAGFLEQLVQMAGPAGPLPPREERLEVVGATTGLAARPVATVSASAARNVGTRPGNRSAAWGRRPGDTRPAGSPPMRRSVSISARTRPRLAAAVVAAACIVGAGVTVGGVAAAGSSAAGQSGQKVVPAVDTFVAEHGATAAVLPFTDQSVVWGTAGAGR